MAESTRAAGGGPPLSGQAPGPVGEGATRASGVGWSVAGRVGDEPTQAVARVESRRQPRTASSDGTYAGSDLDAQQLVDRYAVADFLLLGAADLVRSIPDAVRSYLADGRAVAWNPPVRPVFWAAIDAEIATQQVPPALARHLRCDDPDEVWPRWTRCEVVVKLLDLPVLSWLRWPGLEVPGALADRVAVAHVPIDDALICCGLTRKDSPQARA